MLTSYAIQEARRIAQQELVEEAMRELVATEKERIKKQAASKRWWHRFIPFTITITRRKP